MYRAVLILFCSSLLIISTGAERGLVCEHEKLTLSCQRGYTIDISSALYGRINNLYCEIDKTAEKCAAGNSLDIVRRKCNRKQTCEVEASNEVFGDPCYDVFKYLEVSYECIKDKISTKIECEYLDMNLKCEDGHSLRIVNAFYGRKIPLICLKKLEENYVYNVHKYNCASEKALSVMESRCDNQKECTVGVWDDLFGDPCPYTAKYLQVDYLCLDGVEKNLASRKLTPSLGFGGPLAVKFFNQQRSPFKLLQHPQSGNN